MLKPDEPTPAPGHVDTLELFGKFHSGAESSFKSASQQRGHVANTDSPPPGAYTLRNGLGDDDITRPRVINGGYTMRVQGDRFRASVNTFTHEPAPYLTANAPFYGVQSMPNGQKSTVYGAVRARSADGRSANFRSESVRDLTHKYFASEPYF